MITTPRLRELEAANNTTGRLELNGYKLCLEDLAPVLRAAERVNTCPIGTLHKCLNELRDTMAAFSHD